MCESFVCKTTTCEHHHHVNNTVVNNTTHEHVVIKVNTTRCAVDGELESVESASSLGYRHSRLSGSSAASSLGRRVRVLRQAMVVAGGSSAATCGLATASRHTAW